MSLFSDIADTVRNRDVKIVSDRSLPTLVRQMAVHANVRPYFRYFLNDCTCTNISFSFSWRQPFRLEQLQLASHSHRIGWNDCVTLNESGQKWNKPPLPVEVSHHPMKTLRVSAEAEQRGAQVCVISYCCDNLVFITL